MRIPPIFVISLTGSERRRDISYRLREWTGNWEFVDAIDGRLIQSAELERVYDSQRAYRLCGRGLAPGEIGCALSHRAVYREIMRRNLDSAIVLEDDARLEPGFFAFPFSETRLDFDVISFYSEDAVVRRAPEQRLEGVSLHRAAGKVGNTVAYMVSRSGARKLMQATERISRTADWPMHPLSLSFFLTLPAIAGHTIGTSEIGWREPPSNFRAGERKNALVRFVDRLPLFVSNPLLLRYAAYREHYDGLPDFYQREIEADLKSLFPQFRRVKVRHGPA